MDFVSAVTTINKLLKTIQPPTFCSSWIRLHAPQVYRYLQRNVRTETGGIDWDRFTRALDRKLQRRWNGSRRGRPSKGARDGKAAELILSRHRDKLYTFLSPQNADDEQARDMISIALVRSAQRGNADARREIVDLVQYTVDAWIEQDPKLSCWAGRSDMVHERIEGCLRCYRYSGTFIGYLFKTLEYAGRGLRPIVAYSLDDHLYAGKTRRIDRFMFDHEAVEK
jgi:hypothetical protein